MRLPLALLTCFLPLAATAVPSEDGIFAIFETNHGDFTCELFYEEVPGTVANFVGLAEGSRAWLDLETGLVEERPFYDGLTFHRVIEDFMIQTGSRNGRGTDGPGYQFPDEFHPDLVHAGAGVLSMANSGIDTNGSQFFVTAAATSWLDYRHAVFGQVVEGMDVVLAISEVPTEENDRPEETVVIHSVSIVRNGADAKAFEVSNQGLPQVRGTRAEITGGSAERGVRFAVEPGRSYVLAHSEDLAGWSRAGISPAIDGEDGVFDVGELSIDKERQFYRVAEVDETPVEEAYVPESLVGKTLEIDMVSAGLHINLYPDQEPEENGDESLGTGDFGDDPDNHGLEILDYRWFREKSRGVVLFILDGYVQFDLELLFLDEESGTFSGVVHTDQPPPIVNGTFLFRDRE